MEENKELNEEVTESTETAPITPEEPTSVVEEPAVPVEEPVAAEPEKKEPEPEHEGNGDSITFDYNQLYQSQNAQEQAEQTNEVQQSTEIQETPIVLDNEQPVVQPTPIAKEIVPTFDTSALEDDLPDELKPKAEEQLIHTMATETQKEKQESNQNILFIVIFFAVLIIAVLIIFPMMLGI